MCIDSQLYLTLRIECGNILLLLLLLLQAYAKTSGPASSSLVQLLLQHGATAGNVNAAIGEGYAAMAGVTPLHLLACWAPEAPASSSSSSSATTHASKPGSSSNSSSKKAATGQDDTSAAGGAAVDEQLAVADLLLEHALGQVPAAAALDVNLQCTEGTPLVFAATRGALDLAAWLISKGADVNLPRGYDTARPIDLAVLHGRTEVACLLLEHGAEVIMLCVLGSLEQQQQRQRQQQRRTCHESTIMIFKKPCKPCLLRHWHSASLTGDVTRVL
jgi:hypothetical protein